MGPSSGACVSLDERHRDDGRLQRERQDARDDGDNDGINENRDYKNNYADMVAEKLLLNCFTSWNAYQCR